MKPTLLSLNLLLALSISSAWAEPGGYDEKALSREANQALAQKDFQTAFSKFSVLAEHGKVDSQFNLGAFYINGQGVTKNEQLAYEWFGKAAAGGHAKARQILENSAARGNPYATAELNKLLGIAPTAVAAPAVVAPEPKEAQPKPKVVAKAEEPEPKKEPEKRRRRNLAASSGISLDAASYSLSESVPYSVSGTSSTVTKSVRFTQPGFKAWYGNDDYTLLFGYRSGKGVFKADVTTGTATDDFKMSEFGIELHWQLRQFASSTMKPYVLGGFARNSRSGTSDQLEFTDTYTQTDTILKVGAGALFPLGDDLSLILEASGGPNLQKRSGDYTPAAGVTLSTTSYSSSGTAGYARLAGNLNYSITRNLQAQCAAAYEGYSSSVKGLSFGVSLGLTF